MASIDYSAIISRAWYITKKYKWLWVYGLVLVVFSGGSSYSGSSGGSSSNRSTRPTNNGQGQDKQSMLLEATDVLGAATTQLQQWASSITPVSLIMLAIALFIVFGISIAVYWVIKSWARGSLIKGIQDADQDKEVTLKNTTAYGKALVKPFVLYDLLSGLIVTGSIIVGVLLVLGFILFGALAFKSNLVLQLIWYVLAGLWALVLIIIVAFLSVMVTAYAERLIALHGYTPWQAWKKGISMAKRNWLPTIVLGIINNMIGCIVSCLGLVVLAILGGVPVFLTIMSFTNKNMLSASIPLLITSGFWIFVLLNAFTLLMAMYTVFHYSTWNLLFKEITKEQSV